MEDARQKFQGVCLISTEGYQHMRSVFDKFPPNVRERLRQSPFNLCAACVSDRAFAKRDYMAAIDDMERALRCEAV